MFIPKKNNIIIIAFALATGFSMHAMDDSIISVLPPSPFEQQLAQAIQTAVHKGIETGIQTGVQEAVKKVNPFWTSEKIYLACSASIFIGTIGYTLYKAKQERNAIDQASKARIKLHNKTFTQLASELQTVVDSNFIQMKEKIKEDFDEQKRLLQLLEENSKSDLESLHTTAKYYVTGAQEGLESCSQQLDGLQIVVAGCLSEEKEISNNLNNFSRNFSTITANNKKFFEDVEQTAGEISQGLQEISQAQDHNNVLLASLESTLQHSFQSPDSGFQSLIERFDQFAQQQHGFYEELRELNTILSSK